MQVGMQVKMQAPYAHVTPWELVVGMGTGTGTCAPG